MRLHSFEHIYHHDWDTVTAAFWVKYPNRLQPHVQRVDTLQRAIDVEEKTFITKRLISLRYNIPSWVQRLLRTTADGYGLETVNCDLDNRILRLESENITFSDFLRVNEFCEYQVHPENPNWTIYRQSAWYSVTGFSFASDALEKLAIQTAQDKSSRGLNAMQRAITCLEEANWNEKYNRAKKQAAIAYDHYSETLNGYVTSFAKLLMGDFLDTFCRLETAKQKLMTFRENYGPLLTDAAKYSKLETYDQAKIAYNEALKAVESNLADIRSNTRKFFNFEPTRYFYSSQGIGSNSISEIQTHLLPHINWLLTSTGIPPCNIMARMGLPFLWKTTLAHKEESSQDELSVSIRKNRTAIPGPFFSLLTAVDCSNGTRSPDVLQHPSFPSNSVSYDRHISTFNFCHFRNKLSSALRCAQSTFLYFPARNKISTSIGPYRSHGLLLSSLCSGSCR
ncbi:PRELI family protein [Cardiosporidium cionae]|uniref:PRELI family protein n=1 Tax=Cardiosporidium cionae TaxID=476202 RepID=A0ABQ7J6J4_9APIC|nr:PRELI family protein [Cardiosporidium cionae]|eukprot:KAF8819585.1 PRELI family protein [Cardiosporidium cionae]